MKKIVWLFPLVLLFAAMPLFAGEIHEAAKSGDIAKLKAMLDKDPGLLYVQDELGKTPLHWATGRDQREAMKLLLDTYHVDVDVKNKNNGTPLHVAASQAHPEAALILIQHGATIDPRAKDGSTPLHFACLKGRKDGHIKSAKLLIEHGADVNAKNNRGATSLSMAMSRGNQEIIKLLRAHGAQGKSGANMSGRQRGNMMAGDQEE